jgi:hypothetical protein
MRPHFYIFLDCDGVLHPATWRIPGLIAEGDKRVAEDLLHVYAAGLGYRAFCAGLPFSCLPEFEISIRPFLDHIEIIISSSWRASPEKYAAILEAMTEDVRKRVVGTTPTENPTPWKGRGRPYEIYQWLREHADPDGLAIVIDDDDTYDWHNITNEALLLVVPTSRGFTQDDSHSLRLLLSMDPENVAALKAVLPRVHGQQARLEWVAARITPNL